MYSRTSLRSPKRKPAIPHGSSMAASGVSVALGTSISTQGGIPASRSMPAGSFDDDSGCRDIMLTHSDSVLYGRADQKARAQDMSDILEMSEDRDMELNKTATFQRETKRAPSLSAGRIVTPAQAAAVYAESRKEKQALNQSEMFRRTDETEIDSLVKTAAVPALERNWSMEEENELSRARARELNNSFDVSDLDGLELQRAGTFPSDARRAPSLAAGRMVTPAQAAAAYAESKKALNQNNSTTIRRSVPARSHSTGLSFLRGKRTDDEQKEVSQARAQDLSALHELSDDRNLELNKKGVFQREVKMAPSLAAGRVVTPGQAAALFAESRKAESEAAAMTENNMNDQDPTDSAPPQIRRNPLTEKNTPRYNPPPAKKLTRGEKKIILARQAMRNKPKQSDMPDFC